MGIPAFYRWLVERHPLTVADVIEESPVVVNGVALPVDSTRPNPNGLEFDNLYLDMNGIIHPCFHPEGLPAPMSYEEVFKAVFKYIDKIFSMIRPRKLLYMAIDGVAPRAKMNHQRARRFRAAKDAADEALAEEIVKRDRGTRVEELTRLQQYNKLDSNVITPGTEFMSLLSSALRYYVHLKMNRDPGWKDVKVIVSDASVPGEGEHKIMSYIRLQRNLPGFDPNTRHCLYGLDADLIMLALASHEIHFSILRENVSRPPKRYGSPKDVSNSRGMERKRGFNIKQSHNKNIEGYILRQNFQFLHVWVLRDYLVHELRIPDPSVKADLERLIDDFVFMCMFVGNDFLPHVPSLEIFEGAIDLLMKVYRTEFVQMGGYLTDSWKAGGKTRRQKKKRKLERLLAVATVETLYCRLSKKSSESSSSLLGSTSQSTFINLVNLERLQHFLQAVGSYENVIFKKRSQIEKKMDMLSRDSSSHSRPKKTQSSMNNATSNVEPAIDQVKLEEAGCKERYYALKFEARTDDDRERIRKHTVLKYMEGVCWVMHYYYEGVPSWQWVDEYSIAGNLSSPFKVFKVVELEKKLLPLEELLSLLISPVIFGYNDHETWGATDYMFYPYHYAPFASDFYGLGELQIEFTLGMPFKPFDQLMGVLPAASAHALPLSYRKLMTDPSSPILDFYPSDFERDMNGKRFSWQAICKLPFIKESRLLSELAKVEHTLTNEEKRRNTLGLDVLFVHKSHSLAGKILSFCMKSMNRPKLHEAKVKQKINPEVSGGMNGYLYFSDNLVSPSVIDPPIDDMPIITENEVISAFYKYPSFHFHIPRPPKGVIMPPKSVSKKDVLSPPVLWHEKSSSHGRINQDRRSTKFASYRHVAISAQHLVSMPQTQGSTEVVDRTGMNTVEGKVSDTIASRKRKRRAVRSKETCAKRACADDVEPSPSQKSTASEKKIDGEGKGTEAIASRKRKHRGVQTKKTCANRISLDDMAPVPNQKATASSKEVNGKVKESGIIGSRKRKHRGSRSRKAPANCTSVANVALLPNQKATASLKKVNREGKVSGAIALRKRKHRGGQGEKSRANSTGIADVASVPDPNPSAPMKEVDKQSGAVASRKRKHRGGRAKRDHANRAGVANVESMPNLRQTTSNKSPSAPVKEVNGEGKRGNAITSRKRKHRGGRAVRARANRAGVANMKPFPSQKPTTSDKDIIRGRD